MNARLISVWPRWASRRLRIAFYSIFFGLLAGAINLLMPIEDLAMNLRAAVVRRSAPQDIVVIGIDETTLRHLGREDVTRSDDAALVRKLTRAGAKRIYFDRRYAFKENPSEDADFARAMHETGGKVHLAVGASADYQGGKLEVIPNRIFLPDSKLVGISTFNHAFDLMTSVPLQWDTVVGRVPSMAASLADIPAEPQQPAWLDHLNNQVNGFYRIDYAFDYKTIPTIRYLDVIEGRFDARQVAGRYVVVGPTAESYRDSYPMLLQGTVAGVYYHVMAAHTLRKPFALKLGWLPALFVVSILVVTGLRRRGSIDAKRIAAMAIALGLVPFIFDSYGIEIEIAPALLASCIALFRSWSLHRMVQASETNVVSGLPNLQQLKTSGEVPQGGLIALKLRNYGAIVGSFESSAEARLAQEIARRVRLGDKDAVIYHEGDKFLWLSQIADPVDILEHLEGLHRLVQGGIVIEGRDVDLSFNCGVDLVNAQAMDKRIANALQSAEQAVREDELVCIHDPSSRGVHWEISMLSALDRAIDDGHVWVAYQPKLDIASGRIKGAEALARWTDPERGPISPDKFIQIAEEYHRIDRITRFVLGEAIRTVRDIRAIIPDFTVSVNISAQLLRFAGLTDMILDALRAENMPPDCLVLEITETDRLDRSSRTYAMMQSLVDAGLELSIDDFGTGNATIDYLRFLPAVEVKIDKMFVEAIASNSKDLLLIQSIIEMAHSLDRRVVAEGVENAEMLAALEAVGCDQIQGYHIGRPMRREVLFATLGKAAIKKTG